MSLLNHVAMLTHAYNICSLHSTMSLLNLLVQPVTSNPCLIALHSTMSLLNREAVWQVSKDHGTLHSTMSLLNLQGDQIMRQERCSLHSTMSLLNPAP